MPPTGPRLRRLATAICLCLALTAVAGLALGSLPGGPESHAAVDGDRQLRIVEDRNASNYLQPDRGTDARDAVAYQDVDLGVAVAAGSERLHSHHDRLAFDERFAAAPNRSARLATFRDGVADLARRTADVREARTAARASFRDGTLTAPAYFRELALLDAATDGLETERSRLEEVVGQVGPGAGPSLTRLQNLEADLETMNGPVAAELQGRYRGNDSGATVISVTGDGGFVAATSDDEQFYRVAQETADWSRDGEDRFVTNGSGGLSQALERAADLYPWTFSHQFGSPPPRGVFGTTSLYKIAVVHQSGRLTVYLDGSTEEVYREVQQNRRAAVPQNWSRSATADGLAMTVNGTYASGPLDVSVRDAVSGAGVDSRVRIDGTYVGTTDGSGHLGTVQPYGTFTVNATTAANESVAVTFSRGTP